MAMTITEKNLRAQLRKGKGDSLKLFLQTHDDIKTRYSMEKNSHNMLEVKLIQFYLQRIKNAILTLKINPNAYIADDFIKDFFERCQKRGINPMTLFEYNDLSFSRAGIKFEQDLVNVINACIPDSDFNSSNFAQQFGYNKATSKLEFSKDELTGYYTKWVDALRTNIQTGTEEWVKATFGQKNFGTSDLNLYRLGAVEGKIDILVPQSHLQINFETSPEVEKFFSLINGKKITAKNYFDISSVKLGNTNIFRIYMTILPEVGRSKEESLRMFYIQRYYHNIKKNDDKGLSVLLHDYHIRFTYELMGVGLIYDGEKLGPADLLIINERAGSLIKVYNTYMILGEVLESKSFSKAKTLHFNN